MANKNCCRLIVLLDGNDDFDTLELPMLTTEENKKLYEQWKVVQKKNNSGNKKFHQTKNLRNSESFKKKRSKHRLKVKKSSLQTLNPTPSQNLSSKPSDIRSAPPNPPRHYYAGPEYNYYLPNPYYSNQMAFNRPLRPPNHFINRHARPMNNNQQIQQIGHPPVNYYGGFWNHSTMQAYRPRATASYRPNNRLR